MRLWGDELEALRPQLREEAATFIASFPRIATTGSVDEIVAGHRGASMFGEPSARAVDRMIDGPAGPIRLRTFVPDQVDGVLFHIHGGAWLGGSPEMMDLLHGIAHGHRRTSAVVSVDYRLAPEHPYPAGPDDCEAAALWVVENALREFGCDRLVIGGESAGAHLAARHAAAAARPPRARRPFPRREPHLRRVRPVADAERAAWARRPRSTSSTARFPLDLFLPGLSTRGATGSRHLTALRRPLRHAPRTVLRRDGRPPPRRHALHGGAVGGCGTGPRCSCTPTRRTAASRCRQSPHASSRDCSTSSASASPPRPPSRRSRTPSDLKHPTHLFVTITPEAPRRRPRTPGRGA